MIQIQLMDKKIKSCSSANLTKSFLTRKFKYEERKMRLYECFTSIQVNVEFSDASLATRWVTAASGTTWQRPNEKTPLPLRGTFALIWTRTCAPLVFLTLMLLKSDRLSLFYLPVWIFKILHSFDSLHFETAKIFIFLQNKFHLCNNHFLNNWQLKK